MASWCDPRRVPESLSPESLRNYCGSLPVGKSVIGQKHHAEALLRASIIGDDYHCARVSWHKSIIVEEYHWRRFFHFLDYSNLADFDADYPIRCGMTHPSRCDPLQRLKTSKMRFFDFRPNFAKFDNSTTDRKLSPSCEQPSHRSAPPVFSTTATRDT